MVARTCNLLAEIAMEGASVSIVDYEWRANEQISAYEDEFILRYRPYQARVSLSAQLGARGVQDFGQLMFFPAGTQVHTTPARRNERMRNVVCKFSRDWFGQIWPGRSDWKGEDLAQCYDLRNFRIEQAVQRLASEAESPGFASALFAESIARFMTVDIARHFRSHRAVRRARTFDGKFSASEIGRIHDYIDSLANRCPTAEDVALNCGISSAHLRRAFKRTTGVTLHDYVANARLNKARGLLAETDVPLKEVAYCLGFSSPSTFSAAFRKEAGETPNSYRQRQRGND